MTIISTIVGGGIVGLPYSFLELGFWVTMALMGLIIVQTVNSCWLYLKAKDLMPGKPESLYELGYMLMARKSIFLLSGTLVLNSLGLVMVYFIVFSDTMKSVAMDAFSITENDEGFKHYLAGKQFWILALGVLVLPICLKKEL